MLAVAVLALLLSPLTVIDALDHLVSLPLGDIQGIPCPSDASVTQYLGVPYAQPMLGSLRFRPPQLYNVPYPTPALLATTVPAPCGSICRQRWDAADVSLSSEVSRLDKLSGMARKINIKKHTMSYRQLLRLTSLFSRDPSIVMYQHLFRLSL